MTKVALLLGKDLRVLGRSPVLLGAFILYPLLIAALVGFVIRFAGERPRIAFVDLDNLPETLVVGGESFEVQNVLDQVDDEVELIPLSLEEADRRLENGRVVAAIVVPRGFASTLRGLVRSPTLLLKTARGGPGGRAGAARQAPVCSPPRCRRPRSLFPSPSSASCSPPPRSPPSATRTSSGGWPAASCGWASSSSRRSPSRRCSRSRSGLRLPSSSGS